MKNKKKEIKMLFILPTLNYAGGIEAYIMNYFSYFSSSFKIDFIVHECNNMYYKQLIESRGGKVYLMPKIGVRSIFKFRKELKNFFKKHHDYDIIHCNMANATLFYFKEACKYNIPVRINHSHQNAYADTLSHSIRNYPLIKIGARMANVNFACSKLAGDFLFKNNKYYIINNAIDFSKFIYDDSHRKKIRKEYGILENEFLIGNVGRLAPQKNQLFLIEIMKDIVKKDNNTKLMIVGDGTLREQLETKIDEYSLNKNVILVKGTSEVNKYYSAFDCFVLPSLYEGLGIVNIEAQVSGLDVIVSKEVPVEAKITENLKYLDLNLGAEKWANEILNLKEKKRNLLDNDIYECGYEIKNEVKKVEELYINLLEEKSE